MDTVILQYGWGNHHPPAANPTYTFNLATMDVDATVVRSTVTAIPPAGTHA